MRFDPVLFKMITILLLLLFEWLVLIIITGDNSKSLFIVIHVIQKFSNSGGKILFNRKYSVDHEA